MSSCGQTHRSFIKQKMPPRINEEIIIFFVLTTQTEQNVILCMVQGWLVLLISHFVLWYSLCTCLPSCQGPDWRSSLLSFWNNLFQLSEPSHPDSMSEQSILITARFCSTISKGKYMSGFLLLFWESNSKSFLELYYIMYVQLLCWLAIGVSFPL